MICKKLDETVAFGCLYEEKWYSCMRIQTKRYIDNFKRNLKVYFMFASSMHSKHILVSYNSGILVMNRIDIGDSSIKSIYYWFRTVLQTRLIWDNNDLIFAYDLISICVWSEVDMSTFWCRHEYIYVCWCRHEYGLMSC